MVHEQLEGDRADEVEEEEALEVPLRDFSPPVHPVAVLLE